MDKSATKQLVASIYPDAVYLIGIITLYPKVMNEQAAKCFLEGADVFCCPGGFSNSIEEEDIRGNLFTLIPVYVQQTDKDRLIFRGDGALKNRVRRLDLPVETKTRELILEWAGVTLP